MSEPIAHDSIADLYRSLDLPIDQDMDFAIHSLGEVHHELPFVSPKFRANYFSFVFVKDGRGSYTLDDQVFETEPGTIYFTNPGHIKAFHLKELNEAYIITLTESFLKENVHASVFDEFPFLLAETVPPNVLPQDHFGEFELLYKQIYKEYHTASAYKERVLSNLFMVILLKIKEKFWNNYNPIEEGDRSSQIVKSFKRSLEQHYRDLSVGSLEYHYQVQDYASEQGLHPNYFGHVIKSKTGKTVNAWIAEKMITEAQSLLKNTALTAKEIAHRLGFSEPTHFNSYFKNHTGTTPGKYRKAFKP